MRPVYTDGEAWRVSTGEGPEGWFVGWKPDNAWLGTTTLEVEGPFRVTGDDATPMATFAKVDMVAMTVEFRKNPWKRPMGRRMTMDEREAYAAEFEPGDMFVWRPKNRRSFMTWMEEMGWEEDR